MDQLARQIRDVVRPVAMNHGYFTSPLREVTVRRSGPNRWDISGIPDAPPTIFEVQAIESARALLVGTGGGRIVVHHDDGSTTQEIVPEEPLFTRAFDAPPIVPFGEERHYRQAGPIESPFLEPAEGLRLRRNGDSGRPRLELEWQLEDSFFISYVDLSEVQPTTVARIDPKVQPAPWSTSPLPIPMESLRQACPVWTHFRMGGILELPEDRLTIANEPSASWPEVRLRTTFHGGPIRSVNADLIKLAWTPILVADRIAGELIAVRDTWRSMVPADWVPAATWDDHGLDWAKDIIKAAVDYRELIAEIVKSIRLG